MLGRRTLILILLPLLLLLLLLLPMMSGVAAPILDGRVAGIIAIIVGVYLTVSPNQAAQQGIGMADAIVVIAIPSPVSVVVVVIAGAAATTTAAAATAATTITADAVMPPARTPARHGRVARRLGLGMEAHATGGRVGGCDASNLLVSVVIFVLVVGNCPPPSSAVAGRRGCGSSTNPTPTSQTDVAGGLVIASTSSPMLGGRLRAVRGALGARRARHRSPPSGSGEG